LSETLKHACYLKHRKAGLDEHNMQDSDCNQNLRAGLHDATQLTNMSDEQANFMTHTTSCHTYSCP
jgi:hypothetical protein